MTQFEKVYRIIRYCERHKARGLNSAQPQPGMYLWLDGLNPLLALESEPHTMITAINLNSRGNERYLDLAWEAIA